MRTELESRVLVLAPTGRDAVNATAILRHARLNGQICRSVDELCIDIERGAGAVLITEEALVVKGGRELLGRCLAAQPPWSDLPFVALTAGGPDSPAGQHAMETLGNVILLERPVRISTCLTAIQTALRMRRRQYGTRQHMDQMHSAEQRKDEFLAMLAHELRNPMAPIRNAGQLLAAGARGEPELRFIGEVIERQMGTLTRLVDDLLDVSRITRGKVTLKKEPMPLLRAVAGAVEISRPFIEARRHCLTVELPPADLCVDGDPTRLTQVIANLLNNAAKFTPDGGHIELRAGAVAGGQARISVSDDGAGIDPALLPRVFELFVQGENSLHRSQGGLGIGLTLVRKLAEMHGGEVTAHSAGAARGARFEVRLPCCEAPDGAAVLRAPHLAESRRLRILVVDDNIDAAQSLSRLLSAAGHEVRTTFDGESALRAMADLRPQFCVLDIGLPVMDGYELARRIRADASVDRPRLIALSGYGEARSRERGRQAGFDHYLVKPLEFELLRSILNGAGRTGAAPDKAQQTQHVPTEYARGGAVPESSRA